MEEKAPSSVVFSPAAEYEVKKSNTIVQWTSLAAKVAAKIESQLVIANQSILRRDLDSEYQQKSDTIRIKVPNKTTFALHSDSGNAASAYTEQYRDIKLDGFFTGDHEFTNLELNLALSKNQSEVIDSLSTGAVEKLETYCMEELTLAARGYAGTFGTEISALTDLTAVRKVMNDFKMIPKSDRNLIIDGAAAQILLNLDQWKNYSIIGDTAALKEASLGRRFGMNIWESDYVQTKTATGTFEAKNKTTTGTVVVASNGVMTSSRFAGLPYSAVEFKAASDTAHVDISIGAQGFITDTAGVVHKFVVLEAATSTTSGSDEIVSTKIYPALATACTAGAVTFVEKNKTKASKNLLIQKDSAVLVARPLMPFEDLFSMTFNVNGLPMRLYKFTNGSTKKTTITMDFLVKCQVLRPEGIASLFGAGA